MSGICLCVLYDTWVWRDTKSDGGSGGHGYEENKGIVKTELDNVFVELIWRTEIMTGARV